MNPLMAPEETVHIVPYDPSWPEKFAIEKNLVEETLGSWIAGGVHHVGSTAIPGMSAKPIIDIMVGVKNLNGAKACIPFLEQIQYCYYPYKPDEMIWFCKPSPYKRTHHLYIMEVSHPEWKARIAFRDYLKNHPEAKEEYRKLKTQLAEKYSTDREAYTESKTEFVKMIVSKSLGK
jgi:GrpB-like predicted nucleotidyltransferase (UPF0157 family)